MGNVVDFPKIFRNDSVLAIAEALVDYVRDKPNAKLVVIIKDDETSAGELTMGWNPMDTGEMSLMLRYANYKWEERTFRDGESLYADIT